MIYLRQLVSWHEQARAKTLRPAGVGGVPIEDFRPSPPTCPECGYSDPDAEVVYAHLWTHEGRDRRRRDRRAGAA